MTNNPKYIIIHCTDIPSRQSSSQLGIVDKYHKSIDFPMSSLGYYVGYHSLITGGKNYKCKEDHEQGAHANNSVDGLSLNFQSLGVCVGFDGDIEFMSHEHFKLLKVQIFEWQDKYGISDVNVYFHRDFNKGKSCPGSLLGPEWKKALLTREVAIKTESCTNQEKIIKEQKDFIQKISELLKSFIGVK